MYPTNTIQYHVVVGMNVDIYDDTVKILIDPLELTGEKLLSVPYEDPFITAYRINPIDP